MEQAKVATGNKDKQATRKVTRASWSDEALVMFILTPTAKDATFMLLYRC
jgi:hypothetical protein